MITRDGIEQAYCFLHQKARIYHYSTSISQRDDIEYAISSFVNDMDADLYSYIAEGNNHFLHDHLSFGDEISVAVDKLEMLMNNNSEVSL